ncbi:MAG: class I SAM-dependent methyltransferase family protein [Candidatus Nezhaarchaeota archaeon]|nr:class I SAM-dependent methyltransferase family protein [Candidatus Nezhaarchaeota archaeon]MCX8142483.1 class I SAM-dependent methyltransferase family protein [Candidatus Nezhaarchaeota archaeon]MDW8050544.1 class I SAM-dependent methyltransferase family protein [Nitrososphaerota archaeon]
MPREGLLRRLAKEIVPPHLLDSVPSGFELIGDIAILNLSSKLETYRFKLAEAILNSLKPKVRLIVRRTSPAKDPERVHSYEILAGSGGLETIHRESGCVFKVDISKVFFTSRLQYERLRIASMVKPGEVIINMFAGVGPFSIVIAKKVPDVKIYSIDVNPSAYNLMVENIKLNRVEDKVIPIFGDASQVIETYRLKGIANRVLMPSPEHAIDHLAKAIEALKLEGYIHYYDTAHRGSDVEEYLKCRLSKVLDSLNVRWLMTSSRVVRSVSPLKTYVCADVFITKTH